MKNLIRRLLRRLNIRPGDAGLFAALAVTFDLLHCFCDQWLQNDWAAKNKGHHRGDQGDNGGLYYLDGTPYTPHAPRPRTGALRDDVLVTWGGLGKAATTHHVAVYTLAQLAAAVTVLRATGHKVKFRHLIVGHVLINGVTHWVIDRRTPLYNLAERANKLGYIQAQGKMIKIGDETQWRESGPGTALFELDKSLHRIIGLLAALAITLLAARGRKKRVR